MIISLSFGINIKKNIAIAKKIVIIIQNILII